MLVSPPACGFARGTAIATPAGAVPVQDLSPGDLVLTADRGPLPLVDRLCRTARDGADAPVTLPAGLLGNDRPLRLAPGHCLLVRHPCAQLHFGCGEVLVPAGAFVGALAGALPGVHEDAPRDAPGEVEYHRLLLPAHHLVMAEGALAESLFPPAIHRPVAGDDGRDRSRLSPYLAAGLPPLHPARMKACRMVLHDREARFLALALGLRPDSRPAAPVHA